MPLIDFMCIVEKGKRLAGQEGARRPVADKSNTERKHDIRSAIEDARVIAKGLALEAESILGRRIARVLGGLVLVTVAVVILGMLLDWYIAPTEPKERTDLVLALAQILGGAALLSGLFFTWRTLQVNREGQITERFTRAIDQLGARDSEGRIKLLEIRIGGIYALERIARDSSREYGPVMKVLTTYVRENAPWPPKELAAPTSDEAATQASPPEQQPPPSDIQAILDVLGRREENQVPEDHRVHVDLRDTDLRGAVPPRKSRLQETILMRAHFEGAHLREPHFEGAYLMEAHFERAELMGAHLEGAHLEGADLRGTYHLAQEQIEQAIGDANTKLPESLYRPAKWSRSDNEQSLAPAT